MVTVLHVEDDLALAVEVSGDPWGWLAANPPGQRPGLGADVWVFDEGLTQVLLVQHPWRGWVPPGGRVEPGETPRAAARRELAEETGIVAELRREPAAANVRSYQKGAPATLSLSYVCLVDLASPLSPEAGQPAQWHPLDTDWSTWFPGDAERIRRYAGRLVGHS